MKTLALFMWSLIETGIEIDIECLNALMVTLAYENRNLLSLRARNEISTLDGAT